MESFPQVCWDLEQDVLGTRWDLDRGKEAEDRGLESKGREKIGKRQS